MRLRLFAGKTVVAPRLSVRGATPTTVFYPALLGLMVLSFVLPDFVAVPYDTEFSRPEAWASVSFVVACCLLPLAFTAFRFRGSRTSLWSGVIPLLVLHVHVALLAFGDYPAMVLHDRDAYREAEAHAARFRAVLSSDPDEAAARAVARGETRFLVIDAPGTESPATPGIANDCVVGAYGSVVVMVGWMAATHAEAVDLRARARAFAPRYNRALARRLRIAPEAVERPVARCPHLTRSPGTPRGEWP